MIDLNKPQVVFDKPPCRRCGKPTRFLVDHPWDGDSCWVHDEGGTRACADMQGVADPGICPDCMGVGCCATCRGTGIDPTDGVKGSGDQTLSRQTPMDAPEPKC